MGEKKEVRKAMGVGGTKKQEERGVVLDEVEEKRGRRKDDAI